MMHILAAVNHRMIILSMNMVKILFFVEVGATQLNLSMIILSINVVKFFYRLISFDSLKNFHHLH